MKILLEGEIFSRQKYGGISRYFAEMTRIFTSAGHQVVNLCPLIVNRYLEPHPNLTTWGIRVPVMPRSNRLRVALSSVVAKRIPFESGDVLHETYYGLAPKRKKVPVVSTVYDMIYELSGDRFGDHEAMVKAKLHSLEGAERIICISDWVRNDLARVYPQFAEKAVTIHLGSKPLPNPIRPSASLPKAEFLLYVGLRNGYKNFSCLVSALGILKARRQEIPLVSFGGPAFNGEEKAMFSKYHLCEKDVYHVTGGDAELGWLYRNALAFVYPSKHEGFGIPLLEAMSQECPLVCSSASCIPEIAQSAGIYFDPSSSEDLADKIVEVQDWSVDRRTSWIQSAFEHGRTFTWEACAAKTLALYRTLN